ncbi:MAG: M28 family peptidase, partial [Victivallaceae bacterium]|nr:M28 family peptidase [Victivallaceae bacterium]
ELKRAVRVLFCNDEHNPWHSRAYAAAARERNDKILAVLNQDSIDGKAPEDYDKMLHTILFSTPEGEILARQIAEIGKKYAIPLDCNVAAKGRVNDDEGSFIREGFAAAIQNIGSFPYGDPDYHRPGDIPERVNIENVRLSTQLILAAVLEFAEEV